MTDKPFAVNLTFLPAIVPPDYGAYAQVIIDEGVRIVETAGNNPGPVLAQLKKVGTIILHKCTTIRHAKSAVKLGVDFLSIDGFECGGHVGETDITNFILLSRARQDLSIPFIASGGFADGYGLAAALALGAEGINMGTRFMCTIEAPIHINVKQAIVDAQETDTELLLRRWRNTSRLFRNKVALEALKIERESKTGEFSEVAPYVSGKRGRQVFLNGDIHYGVCSHNTLLSGPYGCLSLSWLPHGINLTDSFNFPPLFPSLRSGLPAKLLASSMISPAARNYLLALKRRRSKPWPKRPHCIPLMEWDRRASFDFTPFFLL